MVRCQEAHKRRHLTPIFCFGLSGRGVPVKFGRGREWRFEAGKFDFPSIVPLEFHLILKVLLVSEMLPKLEASHLSRTIFRLPLGNYRTNP